MLKTLSLSSRGPSVAFLQLALNRALGVGLRLDGIFGTATREALLRFQRRNALAADGIAGRQTQTALLPWYTGFLHHTLRRGDTFYTLAQHYSTSQAAIETANPTLSAQNLPVGASVVVPLPFDVVPTEIPVSSVLVELCIRGLTTRYPFLRAQAFGRSVMGKPLWSLLLGEGDNRVLYSAAHHANEWITSLLLLRWCEELCTAFAASGRIFGRSAAEILNYATVCLVPAVNPDGIDLVTGELSDGRWYEQAAGIARNYPRFAFPDGWKANISGVDLNLQYPALWETAKTNKEALGILSPAPADWVGSAPLTAPEARAMAELTRAFDPALVLAYHTQGEVIYWQFSDYLPPNSRNIAGTFSAVSSYRAEQTPYASAFAGYKDWFIQEWDRPGFTIEAGRGVNPLPLQDLPQIYADNCGILTLGTLLT